MRELIRTQKFIGMLFTFTIILAPIGLTIWAVATQCENLGEYFGENLEQTDWLGFELKECKK